MESPQLTVVIILLLFIFFSPNQPNIRYHTRQEQERVLVEKQQDFDALANTKYGDLPADKVNLTGLHRADGYQLQLIDQAQELSRSQYVDNWYGADRLSPIYYAVDGTIKGDFETVEVQRDPDRMLNLTQLDPFAEYISPVFERNVTDHGGQLVIDLESIDPPLRYLVREIKASISLTGTSGSESWDARLRGVHYPTGSMVFTTSSRKFNGLPALPHFALSEEEFVRAIPVMNASLTKIWRTIDQGQGDDAPILASPKCELIMWMHQKRVSGSNKYAEQLEKELMEPDGAPIGAVPPMAFSATILSPDCGYILKADLLYGPKQAVWTHLIRRLTSALIIVLAGQVFLLKRQMERCATPSTRSRVSYHTFIIAAFSDGLLFFALVGVVATDTSLYLVAGVAAFLCCIHVAFLEVKFIFDIWTVQVGDPNNAEIERQRRAAATTAATPAAPTANPASAPTDPPPSQPASNIPLSGAGLPLPATAQTQTPPTATVTRDNNTPAAPLPVRTTFLSLYSRFYFALINLMFFTLWSASWSPGPRRFYFATLAVIFSSLWLPQIYRNIVRNCRKALTWEYILGTSLLRIVPILYWYLTPRNVLYAAPSPRVAFMLIMWLGLQILIMAAQQFMGPRTFVPERWCPPAYDYHPILYDDLEAGGLPIGEITSASEGKDADSKEGNRKVFDCAICMNEIDVPVISKDERKNGSGRNAWMEQRNYMVTPCRHIFHSECLDGWMNMRLVCPVCREALPPL